QCRWPETAPCARDPTTDNVHLQVQAVDQGSERNTKSTPSPAKDFARALVSLNREVVNFFRAEFHVRAGRLRQSRRFACGNGFTRHADHGSRRRILFQAPAISAA